MIINGYLGRKTYYRPDSDAPIYFTRARYRYDEGAIFHFTQKDCATNEYKQIIPLTAAGLLYVFQFLLRSCAKVVQDDPKSNFSVLLGQASNQMKVLHGSAASIIKALKSEVLLVKIVGKSTKKKSRKDRN